MIIRNEQLEVFEDKAEDDFVQRLAIHLREDYPDAVVRRTESEAKVFELSDEVLNELVKISIQRARSFDLTFESSISAFSAIMFEVAPNFYEYKLSSLCLKDENIEPNDRLDEILKIFNETHWEKVRIDYDVNAWKPITGELETTENTEQQESAENVDFDATLVDVNSQEFATNKSKPSKSLRLDETFMPEKIGKIKDKDKNDELDFDATMLNVDLPKE